jgi:uncharacterized DUF497 family protein
MLPSNFKISQRIADKLERKHKVTQAEILECFLNRSKDLLEDIREEHFTDPPTLWFIAETNHERLLKIVFIEHPNGIYVIKTAYEPNDNEVKIYERYA